MARQASLARLSTAAAALVAASCMPASAAAQTFDDFARSAATWSKASAILGGAPSALEAILAKQGGRPVTTAGSGLRPASYSRPQVRAFKDQARALDDAASGRPDIFGSVALAVGHTKLDQRWRRVQQASIHGAARNYARALADESDMERLERVNRYVNGSIEFVDDSRQFGRADVWTTANDTLRRGRGDCEDYAIAKMQMLREAGFASHDLYLVVLKDLVRRNDHAVLVVRASDRFYLLDNGTDIIADSNDVQDYRPILTFSAAGAWTHGYRVNRKPTMTLADNGMAQNATGPVLAMADQRSRSASPLAFNTGLSR